MSRDSYKTRTAKPPKRTTSQGVLNEAKAHFVLTDPIMSILLTHSQTSPGPLTFPTAQPPEAYFAAIARTIIGQQISTKAARTIYARTEAQFGTMITPATILDATTATLAGCGISPKKITYLKQNAALWPTVPIEDFNSLETEEIIEHLTKLVGIGRWTAEMFCIFTLARPDVFSFGDLGLRQSLYQYYNYKPHYTRKIEATVVAWSPYRSVAALALWHARDTGFVLPEAR